jgi:DNA mismatch repair protein PMS2
MAEIKAIDKASILQICSSQVIIDLKSAVKELVENSVDAGANSVEVKFINYGLLGFEVTDNGKGVREEDFEIIAKRGTTSKIGQFEDIYRIRSLGFRGEALSSLCNIGTVSMLTKQSDQETGWHLKFDKAGTLISKEKVSKKDGTQVIVKDLFHELPVRLIEFRKTYKQQYAKAIQLMQSYAIILTQTKFTVQNNQAESQPFAIVLKTNPAVK